MIEKRSLAIHGENEKAPHDLAVLESFFEHDNAAAVSFSHDTWLPELQTTFLKLATAIRREKPSEVRFITHRIRGCAAMGGAHQIVSNMRALDALVDRLSWRQARGAFREANYFLRDIRAWVDVEYHHLAS